MRENLERLFEELPIGALLLTPDQKIRYTNGEFADFIGYQREELEGMTISELAVPNERKKLKRGIEHLYRGDHHHLELDTAYVRKDGERVWGYPVRVVYPDPTTEDMDLILMLIVDVSARHHLEIELRRSSRMNALGLLAGSIAHDFNNILTVIMTATSLLKSELDEDKTGYEFIRQIDRASKRGQNLTDQLRRFGREETEEAKVIDINEFLRDIAVMFGRLLPPTVRFELQLSAANPTVLTDEGRLHQIVMNLVLNARDAIKGRGTVTVETMPISSEDVERFPDTEQLAPGKYTRLRICDTGEGIPAELIPEIFEPYFTTKGEEGTGIGLTTVYGLVQEDKGYLNVASSEDEGTCFEIYLPATADTRQIQEAFESTE